jgi:hypothetical protein
MVYPTPKSKIVQLAENYRIGREQGCVLVTPKPNGSRWSQLKKNIMKDTKKKGGRPALENKKSFRINVRFDEAELGRVLHNAKIAGMSKSEWVRKSAILRKISPRFTEEPLKAFRAITGASNNLNQLTKKAHQTGLIDVAQECRNTISQINYCLNKLLHHDSEDN